MFSVVKDDMNWVLVVVLVVGDEVVEGRVCIELGVILMDVGELKFLEVEL